MRIRKFELLAYVCISIVSTSAETERMQFCVIVELDFVFPMLQRSIIVN